MSIELMTQAWKTQLPPGQKMVLLALCDHANDQGQQCFPSVVTLAAKCSMSERSVFNHLSELERLEVIRRLNRRGSSTLYQINACNFCTPANSAPLQPLHHPSATVAPPPLQPLHHRPATVAPITINEPSTEPSGNRQKKHVSDTTPFVLPEWIPQDLWDTWHSTPKRKHANVSQKTLAIKKLTQWRDLGLDWNGALESAAMAGWAGLYEPKNESNRKHAVESNYKRERREEFMKWAPGIAAKAPGSSAPTEIVESLNFIAIGGR